MFLDLRYSLLKPYVIEIRVIEIHVSKIRVMQGLDVCYRGVEGV